MDELEIIREVSNSGNVISPCCKSILAMLADIKHSICLECKKKFRWNSDKKDWEEAK